MFGLVKRPRVLLVLLAGLAAPACNRLEYPSQSSPASVPEPVTESRIADRQDVPSPDASQRYGTIKGSVRFVGRRIPASTMVPVGADPQYCGHEHSKEDYVIDPDNRGIRYVIVRLLGKGLKKWPHSQPGYLMLDNKDCRFEPHAAVLTAGSTLELHNSDTIFHTTHAYFGASFNYALPKKGISLKYVIKYPGLTQIVCDKHGWMNAYIWVDRHPFHAVTDTQGRFEILDAPTGTYKLQAWHEQFGKKQAQVIIQADTTAIVDFTYSDEDF